VGQAWVEDVVEDEKAETLGGEVVGVETHKEMGVAALRGGLVGDVRVYEKERPQGKAEGGSRVNTR